MNKNTEKNILDSFKKNVLSQMNKQLMKIEQKRPNINSEKQNIDMDIEMKNESLDTNKSLKDSSNSEQMDLSNEKEYEKGKPNNDSNVSTENSIGDNYSTANSNFESDKINHRENLAKKNIEHIIKDKTKTSNEMEISKEAEISTNYEAQNAREYWDEILDNLKEEEKNLNLDINPQYFEHQNEINPKMRGILIDWLIDVHNKFNYKEETLYITIYIMDSYLSKRHIQRKRFQLLGITSLFISSKINEIYYRRISDYVFIADNAYSIEEIKYMEEEIAKTLNFNFLIPSCLSFYEIITHKFGVSEDLNKYKFGEFLLQNFLTDNRCLYYSYSTIACACCYIVMKFYRMKNYKNCYNNNFYTIKNGYNYDNNGYIVINCAKEVCSVISDIFTSNLQSTNRKYNNNPFFEDIKKVLGSPKQ